MINLSLRGTRSLITVNGVWDEPEMFRSSVCEVSNATP